MTITDEMLSAYIDNELPPQEAARIREALDADAMLAARLEALRAPDKLIAAVYGAIDDEPMPQSVLAMLQGKSAKAGGGNVVAFPSRQWLRSPRQWATPLAASIALAIGVGTGMQIANAPDETRYALAGSVDPASSLFRALETTPSGDSVKLAADMSMTPLLTFQAADGGYCREFSISSRAQNQRAVACRGDKQWIVVIAIADESATTGGYATASSGLNAQFDTFVDAAMSGDALAAEIENDLIARRWQGH
ncbi:MAG: zf-HC2 domain-containing protein [Parvularculaceae bacterium]